VDPEFPKEGHQNTSFQQHKNLPKTPRNAFSDALLMSCFQKIAAGAANKTRRARLI